MRGALPYAHVVVASSGPPSVKKTTSRVLSSSHRWPIFGFWLNSRIVYLVFYPSSPDISFTSRSFSRLRKYIPSIQGFLLTNLSHNKRLSTALTLFNLVID